MNTHISFLGLNGSGADYVAKNGELALSVGCIAVDGQLVPLPPMPTNSAASDIGTSDDNTANASTSGAGNGVGLVPSDYPAFPEIEFGLQRKGYLTYSHRFIVPTTMVPSSSSNNEASQVYATTSEDTANMASAAKAVFQGFLQATRLQAEAKGYFHQPFFLRYALRLTDGQLILPSAPILMLPTTMHPCLAISGCTATDNQSTVTLDNQCYPYFQLRYRILSLPDTWTSRIAAIDIFATEPILTYDPNDISQIGASDYHVDEDAIAGIWADEDYYDFHTARSMGWASTLCWDVTPNHGLKHDLAAASRFYRIASIPFATARVMDRFGDLQVACTSSDAIKAMPMFSEQNLTHCPIKPAFAQEIGGRIHAGGGSLVLPQPFALRSCIARSAPQSESAPIKTTIKVWIQDNDGFYTVDGECYMPYNLADKFPPYLFYPHRGAYLMQIIQGENEWTVNLLQHEQMDGAYWLGDPSSATAPQTTDLTLPDDGADECPRHNVLYTSCVDNPLCFPIVNVVGTGTLMAVAPALQSFSAGQWGQFPIYVFSTDGIWALTATSDGSYAVRQQVSAASCATADGVCPTEDSVAFASEQGIMLLSGSKCVCLSSKIARMARLPDLPHLAELTPCDLPSFQMDFTQCKLRYDSTKRLLWVICDGQAWVYSFVSEQWGQAVLGCDQIAVVTRPINLADGEPVRISSLKLTPPCGRGTKWALYGSDDLDSYQLVASSRLPYSSAILGSPYRFYLLAISTKATTLNGFNISHER